MLVGWSFVACGTYIWARRPANRLGPLMTIVGFLWLLGRTMTLVPNPLVYTVGLWLTDLWAPGFALFLLSFPTGRLASRADLAIVGVFLFVTVPLEFLWFLFLVLDSGLNALGIAPNESAAHVIDTIQRDLISLGSVLLVIALARRWLRSSGPVRRQMVPVLVGAVAILLQSASWILFSSGTSLEPLDDLIARGPDRDPDRGPIRDPPVPDGPRRRRGPRRRARADPDAGPPPRCPRQRARRSHPCRWPTGRRSQDRFVDAAGEPIELPEEGSGQAVTLLERNGVPEAAIIHDAILLEEPGLIASVASAMRLAVENDRLTAEVEAQLQEVRASRARIVEAGDLERRRVERDLHDGAQQRLISLSLELRVARSKRVGRRRRPSSPTQPGSGSR